jgi:hypothetical protein
MRGQMKNRVGVDFAHNIQHRTHVHQVAFVDRGLAGKLAEVVLRGAVPARKAVEFDLGLMLSNVISQVAAARAADTGDEHSLEGARHGIHPTETLRLRKLR